MITVSYVEGDRLRIETRAHVTYADQPAVDGGDDTAPTPTEMFVSSLAACVAFYAERYLRRHHLATKGLKVRCDYAWAENPHRVGGIEVVIEAPGLPPTQREAFGRVVAHCTVHNSLEHPPEVRLSIDGKGQSAAA